MTHKCTHGLRSCLEHPRWHVIGLQYAKFRHGKYHALFHVFASGDDHRAKFHTLVEAMNYATAMARGGDAW